MYAKQIAKGIAWLDEQHGGRHWVSNVHAAKLNLASQYTCVLGQLYGKFTRVVDTGGISRMMEHTLNRTLYSKSLLWAVNHGFAVKGKPGVIGEIKYATLTLEWMAAIKLMQLAYKAEESTPEPVEPEVVTAPEPVVESPFGTPSPLQIDDLQGVRKN